MPAFSILPDDVRDLYEFFRSIAAPAGGAGGGRNTIIAVVVGDAAAGRGVTSTAPACTACHSATGDLKGIGARLPVAAIQGRAVMPRGNGGYPPRSTRRRIRAEAPRTVTVTPPSGDR